MYFLLIAAAPILPLLAQEASGQKYGLGVGIIVLCVVLGLIITLTPAKRTYEVKKPTADED
jgi:hypothetical protein